MLSKTISGDESSVKNATKFHIARCILHKVKIEKIVFVVFSLFSVCGNVTTWSAAHIVHYWCLPGVANLRGGTHTQEGEFSWTWHWAFWAFDLTSALAESTSCTFLHCGIFPSLIFGFFCVFCTLYFALLMAQVCWEYRGRDSAGEGKDTGTWGPTVATFLQL